MMSLTTKQQNRAVWSLLLFRCRKTERMFSVEEKKGILKTKTQVVPPNVRDPSHSHEFLVSGKEYDVNLVVEDLVCDDSVELTVHVTFLCRFARRYHG